MRIFSDSGNTYIISNCVPSARFAYTEIKQIAGCGKIEKVYLQYNEGLTSEGPKELVNLASLTLLHLNKGDLEIKGDLGEDAKAVKEIWIGLGGFEDTLTNLNGNDIYKWVGVKIEKCRVTEICWSDKELTGEIKGDIGKLKMLNYLDLSVNSLSGYIPPEIGNLEELTICNLGENFLEVVEGGELGEATTIRMLSSFLKSNSSLSFSCHRPNTS